MIVQYVGILTVFSDYYWNVMLNDEHSTIILINMTNFRIDRVLIRLIDGYLRNSVRFKYIALVFDN